LLVFSVVTLCGVKLTMRSSETSYYHLPDQRRQNPYHDRHVHRRENLKSHQKLSLFSSKYLNLIKCVNSTLSLENRKVSLPTAKPRHWVVGLCCCLQQETLVAWHSSLAAAGYRRTAADWCSKQVPTDCEPQALSLCEDTPSFFSFLV
jgi:hypothetical protein